MIITEIYFNLYRAFFQQARNSEGAFIPTFQISDKQPNVLIYGENGSGKSSIFKGLAHFFESAHNKQLDFEQHLFSKGELEINPKILNKEPFIKLKFSDNQEAIFTPNEDKNTSENINALKESNKAKGFLSYKDLLKIHLIDSEINLFELFMGKGGLLYYVENEYDLNAGLKSKKGIGELFIDILNSKEVDNEAILNDFNKGLEVILEDLKNDTNKMLETFKQNFKVERFDFEALTSETLSKGKISPMISINNKVIPDFQHFLNEARLTALAICVYFSAILKSPERNLKILFLDDIFIGLDMSNRLPLLAILNEEFTDYQIFITTYDRAWFEVAKNYLASSKWQSVEMYVGKEESMGFDIPVILQSKDYLQRAKEHFAAFDYAACANYLRKECERLIKVFLPQNLKHSQDAKKGIINEIDDLETLFNNLLKYLKAQGLSEQDFKNFKTYQKVIFNALSHDDLKSVVYKRELEESFKLVEKLQLLKFVGEVKENTLLYFEIENPQTHIIQKYEIQLIEKLRLLEQNGQQYWSKSLCNVVDVNNRKIYWEKKSLQKIFDNIRNDLGYEKDFDTNQWFWEVKDVKMKTLQTLIQGI